MLKCTCKFDITDVISSTLNMYLFIERNSLYINLNSQSKTTQGFYMEDLQS